MFWQPMETAPRDGRRVVLAWGPNADGGHVVLVARWCGCWRNVADGLAVDLPCHLEVRWLPLPPTDAEFAATNPRRGDLIGRDVRGGLPPAEAAELARLQAESLLYLQAKFPAPGPGELLESLVAAKEAAAGYAYPTFEDYEREVFSGVKSPQAEGIDFVLSPNDQALRNVLRTAWDRARLLKETKETT